MDKISKKAIEHVKKHHKELTSSLELYEEDPTLVRNWFAEMGMELTPDELMTYMALMKGLLEKHG